MAKKAYIGIDNKARKVKKMYIGVDGVARKIKKAYIGVGGVARPCFGGGELVRYGTASRLGWARDSLAATAVGDYAIFGGDYIRLLDWLEETGRNYPIRIHSMNPVGVANMRAIIERNGWKEIR